MIVVDALAKKATKAILDDLGDRSGYDAIWDELDDEVRDDIRSSMYNEVAVQIKAALNMRNSIDDVTKTIMELIK